MGRILNPVLSVSRTDVATATLKLDYTIDFEPSDYGIMYHVFVMISEHDKFLGLGYRILHSEIVADKILATSAHVSRCERMTLNREILNEDKNGIDEIYADIRIQPNGKAVTVKTNEIQRKF